MRYVLLGGCPTIVAQTEVCATDLQIFSRRSVFVESKAAKSKQAAAIMQYRDPRYLSGFYVPL